MNQMTATTYPITDVNPVFLGCRVENGALDLTHDGTPIDGRELWLWLSAPGEIRVAITDFEHDGNRYRVDAFTSESGGALTPWERIGEGVRSPALVAASREVLEVVVMARYQLPAGVTAREAQDYAPQPSYSLDGVKIRLPSPEDGKPGD